MDWSKIEFYEVTTFAKTDMDALPTSGRDLTRITFYAENRLIGAAHFFPEDQDTPANEVEYVRGDEEKPVITLYYRMSMLKTVLNILQHEKPIWLFYGNPLNCGLTSGKEAVGEQEGGAFAQDERRRRR